MIIIIINLTLTGYLKHGAHLNSNCTHIHSHTRKHTNKIQNKNSQSPATLDFPKSSKYNWLLFVVLTLRLRLCSAET